MNTTEYTSEIKNQIKNIMNSEQPIILFGAMAVGIRAARALASMGKMVACFCDNDVRKQGKMVEGIAVKSPQEAYKIYGDSLVFVCLLNPKNQEAVSEQMHNLGFKHTYASDALEYLYQISYLNRNIEQDKLLDTMCYLRQSEGKVVLRTIGISTGSYCTLNCRDCIAQIPNMHHKEHYDKDIIMNQMRRLSECVDAIEAFHIVGGEPFLYPWLGEICRAAADIDNVERVTVFTNGTVVPNDEVLQMLRETVTSVRISQYLNLGYSIEPLTQKLESYGIVYEVDDSTQWSKHPYPQKKNRTRQELQKIYTECFWKTQPGIRQGKLRTCCFSESISPFFDVNERLGDYVDVLDESKSTEEIRSEIVALGEVASISACDYCDSYLMQPAERGVQKP